MRAYHLVFAALGLAACSGAVPDSGLGVGFQDYDTYIANRQAVLAQPMSAGAGTLPPAGGFSAAAASAAIANANANANAQGTAPLGGAYANPLAPRSLQEQATLLGGAQPASLSSIAAPLAAAADPNAGRVIGSAPLAPAANGELAAVRPRGNAPAGITETVSEMAAVGGVSDEQDFEAVAARETIESDKARIERNRAQYQIDQPGALPQRTGPLGPSIVEYALATQHPVGVKLFRRSPFKFKKVEVACAPYGNADLAQEAFLGAGGPDRDRLGVDPDGDGYACGWDPSPYRAVVP
jgi:hypothetical protein